MPLKKFLCEEEGMNAITMKYSMGKLSTNLPMTRKSMPWFNLSRSEALFYGKGYHHPHRSPTATIFASPK
jgi:hypothetical protein